MEQGGGHGTARKLSRGYRFSLRARRDSIKLRARVRCPLLPAAYSLPRRLYTSGRDLEEISPTLAHDLLAVLTRIQPAKMT